ncbi:DUF6285 domain-containing protein [Rhodospirillaceae bacterium SYSU D60014]|uniref:DUF6285 domain-containing protein n=1 Tax=Virgifigura deserti TaxID=2268457 RepID=UPI000E66C769
MIADPTDRPTGAELLAEARRLLIDNLLSLLPPERRYDARMIANAMAIAARELEAGDEPVRTALNDLAALYDEPVDLGAVAAVLQQRLADLEHRLAEDIRGGRFDAADARRDAVQAYLRASVLARLRISNPKALPYSDPISSPTSSR